VVVVPSWIVAMVVAVAVIHCHGHDTPSMIHLDYVNASSDMSPAVVVVGGVALLLLLLCL
jgi:hypothetical protein